MQNFSSSHAF
jgi:hypothetical protein